MKKIFRCSFVLALLLTGIVIFDGDVYGQEVIGSASIWVSDFGYDDGWRVDEHPRMIADVTGDGREDVIAFGTSYIYVATAKATEDGFNAPGIWSSDFTYDAGWRIDKHPRMMADVNGDNRADIVGFGNGGVIVATSNGNGFDGPTLWLSNFGYSDGAGGWRVDKHPRMMADVNGDNRADIVGFGGGGVFVATSTGTGFTSPSLWSDNFGYSDEAGAWRVDKHPRMMADMNNDGLDDIVGFGDSYVSVALSTGVGFEAAEPWVVGFNYNAGWRVDKHPRMVADVNGDGRTDVVGFYDDGVWIAISNGTHFYAPGKSLDDFGYNAEAGSWRIDQHPRMMADVNGDGRADVVGFGENGVSVATAKNDSYGFNPPTIWNSDYGTAGGWQVDKHPRMMADVDGDNRADIVGFGYAGVSVSLSEEPGVFE